MENKNLIGIFDSGVGGFSVYKRIQEVTTADCIYYGDCMRAPYGNREEPEIISFIKDDIRFLQDMDVTHFVNACNSMSVFTTNQVLKESNLKPDNYIDMIRAFDIHALFTRDAIVLIIATAATIHSEAYQKVLTKKGVAFYTFIYEDLAYAIENNASRKELLTIVEKSIIFAQSIKATHIVYGCTHYPLIGMLFEEIKNKILWHGEFIDPAMYVLEEVKKWNLKGQSSFVPYSSKDTPAFISNVIKFL